jgi:putative ABC transport system permease protein
VADVRQFNVTNTAPAGITGAIYMPYSQSVDGGGRIPHVMNLVVKTGAGASQAAEELHRFAAGLNPDIPVSGAIYLDGLAGESISKFRSTAWLFLSFAIVAVGLAAIGIYGLVSYSVTQRAYEIAVRLAIGGSRGSILIMVLARSLRVGLSGMSAGLIGALLAARGLSALLPGTGPADPVVYVCACLFLLTVTLLASIIPAWHASRIEPVRVLRAE